MKLKKRYYVNDVRKVDNVVAILIGLIKRHLHDRCSPMAVFVLTWLSVSPLFRLSLLFS